MATDKICRFKDYLKCEDDKNLSKTRKKMNKKDKKGRSKNVYGWAGYGPPPNLSGTGPVAGSNSNGGAMGGNGGGNGGGGMGESFNHQEEPEFRHPKRIFNKDTRGMHFINYLRDENEEYDEEMLDDEMEPSDEMPEDEMPNDEMYPGEEESEYEPIGHEMEEIEKKIDVLQMAIDKLRAEVKGQSDSSEDEYDSEYDGEYDDEEYGDEESGDEEYGGERSYEEEVEEEPTKKDEAKNLYIALRGTKTRQEIVDTFQKHLGLKKSTAVAYYERIAKEMGDTGKVGKPQVPGGGFGMPPPGSIQGTPVEEPVQYQEPQEWENPNMAGDIRTVDDAHLVFKRQSDDGSFEELWIYHKGKTGEDYKSELEVRRDILAGTDIPVHKTQSKDGSQKSDTWTSGNVQMMHITGLVN